VPREFGRETGVPKGIGVLLSSEVKKRHEGRREATGPWLLRGKRKNTNPKRKKVWVPSSATPPRDLWGSTGVYEGVGVLLARVVCSVLA